MERDCINEIDSITLEKYDEIDTCLIIYLVVGGKMRFYNVHALYTWVFSNNRQYEPETRIPLSKWQLKKIRTHYNKNINITPTPQSLMRLQAIFPSFTQLELKHTINELQDMGNDDFAQRVDAVLPIVEKMFKNTQIFSQSGVSSDIFLGIRQQIIDLYSQKKLTSMFDNITPVQTNIIQDIIGANPDMLNLESLR
jgi:hypothetical protein